MAQSSFGGFILPRPDKKGGGSNIKSIQSGTANLSASQLTLTIPITTVDMSKSYVVAYAVPMNASPTNDASTATVQLQAGGTSLIVTRQGTSGNTIAMEVRWQVIEYYVVKSLQRGTYTHTGLLDITISAVDITKSIFSYTSSTPSTTNITVDALTDGRLVTSTAITTRTNTPAGHTFAWEVVEFY